MNPPAAFPDPNDDAENEDKALAMERHVSHQEFLKENRKAFFDPPNPKHPNTKKLLTIYRDVLVGPPHFTTAFYEIAHTAKMMNRLTLGRVPAAYTVGGYQKGVFKLPAKETEESLKVRLMEQVLDCARYSLMLQRLKEPGEKWKQVADQYPDAFKDAVKNRDGSWNKEELKRVANEEEPVKDRAITATMHNVGPWLITFHPEDGDWLNNWNECLGFIEALNLVPCRTRFAPYLFAIFPIDVRKTVTPPAPPSTAAAPAPAAVSPTSPPKKDQPPPQPPPANDAPAPDGL